MGQLLAFDVAAVLALGLEEETDRPGLAVEHGLVQGQLRGVDHLLALGRDGLLELGPALAVVQHRLPRDPERLGRQVHAPTVCLHRGNHVGLRLLGWYQRLSSRPIRRAMENGLNPARVCCALMVWWYSLVLQRLLLAPSPPGMFSAPTATVA